MISLAVNPGRSRIDGGAWGPNNTQLDCNELNQSYTIEPSSCDPSPLVPVAAFGLNKLANATVNTHCLALTHCATLCLFAPVSHSLNLLHRKHSLTVPLTHSLCHTLPDCYAL